MNFRTMEQIYFGKMEEGKYGLIHVIEHGPPSVNLNLDVHHIPAYLSGIVAYRKENGLEFYNGMEGIFESIGESELEEILEPFPSTKERVLNTIQKSP